MAGSSSHGGDLTLCVQYINSALFLGSFSVSVLSGKIMFRAVHFITEDFSARIEYGWIIFKWWRPYVYKDVKEGNHVLLKAKNQIKRFALAKC